MQAARGDGQGVVPCAGGEGKRGETRFTAPCEATACTQLHRTTRRPTALPCLPRHVAAYGAELADSRGDRGPSCSRQVVGLARGLPLELSLQRSAATHAHPLTTTSLRCSAATHAHP